MNKAEWVVLNSGLDGKQIFGLDTSLGLLEESGYRAIIETAKNGLKDKLLFQEDGTLSPLGFLMMQNLSFYKQSESYLTINHHTKIGVQPGAEAPVFIVNGDDIRLKRMYKEDIMKQLIETYSCFTNKKEYVAISQNVKNAEMLKRLLPVKDKIFHLYTNQPEENLTYFEEAGKCFLYKPQDQTLTPATGAQIEKKVRKILKMEEPTNG